jgi:hypothetical protein
LRGRRRERLRGIGETGKTRTLFWRVDACLTTLSFPEHNFIKNNLATSTHPLYHNW